MIYDLWLWGLGALGAVVVLYLLREIVTAYFKISRVVELLERQNDLLQQITEALTLDPRQNLGPDPPGHTDDDTERP